MVINILSKGNNNDNTNKFEIDTLELENLKRK